MSESNNPSEIFEGPNSSLKKTFEDVTTPSWEASLEHWIKTQHGTAGWQMKLENLIRDLLDRQREEDFKLMQKHWEEHGGSSLLSFVGEYQSLLAKK